MNIPWPEILTLMMSLKLFLNRCSKERNLIVPTKTFCFKIKIVIFSSNEKLSLKILKSNYFLLFILTYYKITNYYDGKSFIGWERIPFDLFAKELKRYSYATVLNI